MKYILLQSDSSKRQCEMIILGEYDKINKVPKKKGTELTIKFLSK